MSIPPELGYVIIVGGIAVGVFLVLRARSKRPDVVSGRRRDSRNDQQK